MPDRVAFDPPPGIFSNDTTYSVPGLWGDCANMRFVGKHPQTIGGWQPIFETALTGVCRSVFNWTNATGVANIAFGTHTALQVYLAGTLSTITPAGLIDGSISNGSEGLAYGEGYYGEGPYSSPPSVTRLRTWSLDSWGETLLASPRYGPLYQWSNATATPAQVIAEAPEQIVSMLVTPQRQVLALGCNEEVSGDFNPLCIRWCDIEGLTTWATSASNNAGEYILEGGGEIVTGLMVGEIIGVWTDKGLHQGVYVGDADQTYRFDRVDENCGIIGPKAVCVHRGVAYYIGMDRQPRVWVYGGKPTIIPCPIWDDFADNLDLDQPDKIIAVSNSRFNEIWFFYPDTRDGSENSRYISLNTENGIWSKGDVARTAACDAGVLSYPQAVTYAGAAYFHENGTTAAGSPLSWRIRSAAQYLNEAERWMQVQRCTPDFKGQENDLTLTAYARSHPQAEAYTKGPYTFTTTTTKKDFLFSAAIVELEWEGTGYVRFGKPTFDAIMLGYH